MINAALSILTIVLLGIIQVSFLSTWPRPISSLNLVLSLVVFLSVIIDYQKGLLWALGLGLVLELFSGLPFGITSLSLLITVILVNFLFSNFFTNRSLYSLMMLGFIATVVYNLVVMVGSFTAALLGADLNLINFNFSAQFVWQPFLNLIVLALIFMAFYVSTGRLKNFFLFTPNSYETKWKR